LITSDNGFCGGKLDTLIDPGWGEKAALFRFASLHPGYGTSIIRYFSFFIQNRLPVKAK